MSAKAGFGVATLRAAAQRRADDTSLRATAAEIGMSYTGLRGFLRGGKPHPETLRRLVVWYARRRGGHAGGAVPVKDVEAALTLLTHYIRQAGTPALLRERVDRVLRSLEEEVREPGSSMPPRRRSPRGGRER